LWSFGIAILWSFGIFSRFGIFVPRKIWQPWFQSHLCSVFLKSKP
jgi:hypothetical protein